MMRETAENNLRPDDYCDKFDPDKVAKKRDIFKTFSNWLSDFNQLTKKMETLELSEERKYHYLKNRLGGKARRLVCYY